MKAMRFHEYGDSGALRLDEVAVPQPGPGAVRIRVAGVAFNPLDAGLRGGWVRDAFPLELPHTPGYDVAGTVDAVGDGVVRPAVGDAVIGFLSMTADGAAADAVVAPADALVAAPATIPLADAAALPSTGTTAWQALFDAGGLAAGQRVLINGAGGAVGRLAVQLAKDAGATVVAETSAAGVEGARALGADEVVVHGAASGAAVDLLLNLGPIGPDESAALASRVRAGGTIVNTVPQAAMPADGEGGVRVVPFFVHPDTADLERLVALVDRGVLRVEVAERLALADLPSVHARSDAGALRGKVVLVP